MIQTELKPIDNIKAMYKKVGNKVRFITALSEVVDRAPKTLANHWFREYWSVPVDHQETVILFMQKYIKNLNDKKSA